MGRRHAVGLQVDIDGTRCTQRDYPDIALPGDRFDPAPHGERAMDLDEGESCEDALGAMRHWGKAHQRATRRVGAGA